MTRSHHSRRGCRSDTSRRIERRLWECDQGATRANVQRCSRYDQADEVEAEATWAWSSSSSSDWAEDDGAPHPTPLATNTNGSARRRSRRARAAHHQPAAGAAASPPPPPTSAITIGIDEPEEAEDDFDLISEPGSEWSVVSSAETSWTLPVWHDADAPDAPWPETGDDEEIARMLQREEQRSFIAVYPVVRGGGLSGGGGARCVLQPEEEALLEERLGVCVVCSESVATVLMEPCGHLAMCGGCHDSWVAVGGRLTCAMCRTPANAIHLLGEHSEDACGVNVRLLDGRVCVPSLDPIAEDERERERAAAGAAAAAATARSSSSRVDGATRSLAAASSPRAPHPTGCDTKLRYRQELRILTRQARARTRARGAGSGASRAGGLVGRRAQEAEAAAQWKKHGEGLAAWRCNRAVLRSLARSAELMGRVRQASTYGVVHLPDGWRQLRGAPPWCQTVEADARARRVQAKRQLQWRERHADPPRPDCVRVGADYRGGRAGFDWPWASYRTQYSLTGGASARAARNSVAVKKAALRKQLALAAEERAFGKEARLARGREAYRLALAAVEGARRVAAAPRECVACGEAEACMLALPCRHTALCRRCWEGRERCGEVCAQCGAPCSVSICVHRP